MKYSGIEWIGEIPEDWGVVKAKYILKSNDGGVWGRDPTGTEKDKTVIRSTEQTIDGTWCIVNPAKRNLSGISFEKSLIRENDLLLTKSSGSSLHIGKTTLADAYFEEHECYYSNFLQRLSLKRTVFPKLYWYIFNSIFVREQFVYLQNSTSGIGNINSDNINNVIVPTLPYDMQQKIVAILDVKCAEIDKLIANQQGQIDKLKEYKQSIITEAVTKGLDPSVPMKDSGVEWIGSIPEEWKIFTIGTLFSYRNEKVSDKVFPPLSVSQRGVVPQIETVAKTDSGDNRKKVLSGDFVINSRSDRKQSCGLSKLNGSVSLINIVLTIRNKSILLDYTKWLLKNYGFADEFYRWGHGIVSDLWTTTWQEMKSILLPIPTIREQQQIADYLDDKCGKIDQLIAIKQQKIDKLQQYKKSLIYEYVTGKKEVV